MLLPENELHLSNIALLPTIIYFLIRRRRYPIDRPHLAVIFLVNIFILRWRAVKHWELLCNFLIYLCFMSWVRLKCGQRVLELKLVFDSRLRVIAIVLVDRRLWVKWNLWQIAIRLVMDDRVSVVTLVVSFTTKITVSFALMYSVATVWLVDQRRLWNLLLYFIVTSRTRVDLRVKITAAMGISRSLR